MPRPNLSSVLPMGLMVSVLLDSLKLKKQRLKPLLLKGIANT